MINIPANFAPNSKLWIFVCSTQLSAMQCNELMEQMNHFVANWKAHNKPLQAVFDYKNRILWVCVNANTENASGCSIDTLYQQIARLETALSCSFTDRMWLYNSEQLCLHAIKDASKLHLLQNKPVLDLSISQAQQANSAFIASNQSWAKLKIYN